MKTYELTQEELQQKYDSIRATAKLQETDGRLEMGKLVVDKYYCRRGAEGSLTILIVTISDDEIKSISTINKTEYKYVGAEEE